MLVLFGDVCQVAEGDRARPQARGLDVTAENRFDPEASVLEPRNLFQDSASEGALPGKVWEERLNEVALDLSDADFRRVGEDGAKEILDMPVVSPTRSPSSRRMT